MQADEPVGATKAAGGEYAIQGQNLGGCRPGSFGVEDLNRIYGTQITFSQHLKHKVSK